MRSSAALLISVLLVSVVSGVGAGLPSDDPAHPSSADAASPVAALDGPRPAALDAPATLTSASSTTTKSSNGTVHDETEMYVSLRQNGDARWNVTAQFALDDQNETAAFRELATEYERGTADLGFTRTTFERVAERAASDTDRPMSIRGVSRTASVGPNGSVGVLSLSFTWTNFTRVEEDRIALDDAFWVESETWLPSLTGDQTLVVEGPTGYYVSSSNVPHNGTRVRYEGPRTFERGDFSITYAPKSTREESGLLDDLLDLSSTSGLVVVLFIFGLGGGSMVYAMTRRRGPDPVEETDGPAGTPRGSSTPDEHSDDSDDAEADDPPVELLSDEERVLRLLRENDGRMKQARIVEETNWSNAKVSQLLSSMSEDGDVDKLRIGRENLITLPDEDVTDVD